MPQIADRERPSPAGLPRFSAGVSIASVLAVLGLVASVPVALAFAGGGGLAVVAGLLRRSELALTAGVSGLFIAVIQAGTGAGSPEWLLGATAPVVLAWVTARHALRLETQIGVEAPTLRVELVHTISVGTLLTAGGGVGYLIYRSVTGTPSPLALGLLLLAVVAFTVALR
ncbi:hypothetical protein SAMN05443574_10325 [Haloarcula vallismortis]|uniref:Uncharacterized protein n=2 Tax=Haloarcula vallismortis TaxID=28442 RepID=M0JUI2_HALVA|nr:hypothetical protein [Haloarcula vallismortis]EMA11325.1 hypothetical protein C437_00395 [Haloarcula vallismortis ATCC 29715]SDW37994.1 hypothetical protein SAMN05443574_10325 [Haloarcula vallismortis]